MTSGTTVTCSGSILQSSRRCANGDKGIRMPFGSGHRVSDVAARHGTDHRVLDRRSDREVLLGASHRGQRYAAAVRRRADRGDNRRR
jgi:hypothetical protein